MGSSFLSSLQHIIRSVKSHPESSCSLQPPARNDRHPVVHWLNPSSLPPPQTANSTIITPLEEVGYSHIYIYPRYNQQQPRSPTPHLVIQSPKEQVSPSPNPPAKRHPILTPTSIIGPHTHPLYHKNSQTPHHMFIPSILTSPLPLSHPLPSSHPQHRSQTRSHPHS